MKKTYSEYSLHHKYGLPEGSKVLVNSSAWLKCVQQLATGVRKMPVSCFIFLLEHILIECTDSIVLYFYSTGYQRLSRMVGMHNNGQVWFVM